MKAFLIPPALGLIFVLMASCGGDDDSSGDDDVSDDDAEDDDSADDDTADDDAVVDDADDDDTVESDFVFIPSGAFTMGSPVDEPGRFASEIQHQVALTHDFEMSAHEMTQDRFASVMDWNPSYFGPGGGGPDCGGGCPVEQVTWFDAAAYANELSGEAGYAPCYAFSGVVCENGANTGSNYRECMNSDKGGIRSANVALNGVTSVYNCEGYRLPTEAEWEYAARAGTNTAFYLGGITYPLHCEPLDANMDAIGWYCGNQGARTEAVGQKLANSWGLYDMSGNAWEWTWDWYEPYAGDVTDPEGPGDGVLRLIRGGGWLDFAMYCRSALRFGIFPGARFGDMGFRLVRSLP